MAGNKPTDEPSGVAPDPTAGWEERSVQRVLEKGREQILERSRRIVEKAWSFTCRKPSSEPGQPLTANHTDRGS